MSTETTKWVKVPDDDKFAILNRHRFKMADGRTIEVAIHTVMYGWRIIANYVGDHTYVLNWCCGDNKIVLYATQKIVMNLIEQGTPINNIPFCSDIKPWPKDAEFIEKVAKLIKNPLFPEIVAVMDGTRPEI